MFLPVLSLFVMIAMAILCCIMGDFPCAVHHVYYGPTWKVPEWCPAIDMIKMHTNIHNTYIHTWCATVAVSPGWVSLAWLHSHGFWWLNRVWLERFPCVHACRQFTALSLFGMTAWPQYFMVTERFMSLTGDLPE